MADVDLIWRKPAQIVHLWICFSPLQQFQRASPMNCMYLKVHFECQFSFHKNAKHFLFPWGAYPRSSHRDLNITDLHTFTTFWTDQWNEYLNISSVYHIELLVHWVCLGCQSPLVSLYLHPQFSNSLLCPMLSFIGN